MDLSSGSGSVRTFLGSRTRIKTYASPKHWNKHVKYLLLTLSYLNIPICDNNRYRYIRIKYEYTIRDFFNFYNFIMCVWVCVTSPITGPVNRHVQHWWIRKYGMAAKCLYRLKCEHYLIVFKGQYYRYLILVVPASGWRIRDPDLFPGSEGFALKMKSTEPVMFRIYLMA